MPITWNPADKHVNITLSNGNLTATLTDDGSAAARTTEAKSSGKWYWEVAIGQSNPEAGVCIGIGTSSTSLSADLGSEVHSYAYVPWGSKCHSGSYEAFGDAFTTGDIVGIALDLNDGKVWWSKNGVWQASGDPANGNNPAYTGVSGTFFPMFSAWMNTDYVTAKFTSEGLTYSPPSGFSVFDEGFLGVIQDEVGTGDQFNAFNLTDEIDNAFGVNDQFNCFNLTDGISEGIGLTDQFRGLTPGKITDDAGLGSSLLGGFDVPVSIEDEAGTDNTLARIVEVSKSISNETGIADQLSVIRAFHRSVEEACILGDSSLGSLHFQYQCSENLSLWEQLKWGWLKAIADQVTATDAVDKILAIPVSDWLSIKDAQANTWKGQEVVVSSLLALDTATLVQLYDDLIADSLTVADAVRLSLELVIIDALILNTVLAVIGKFGYSSEEDFVLADSAKYGWEKIITDSFATADSTLIKWLLMSTVADGVTLTDAVVRTFTVTQIIAESFEAADVSTLSQILQGIVNDGLTLEVLVELDGELWECWVLNSSKFHPSVYSGYDFNSYAIFNDVAYGCRSDGIYRLEGDTDAGGDFHSGIVLPATMFGSASKKRFRKAYLGVAGEDLAVRLETESGYRTYKIIDSEVSITRDLKGRRWKLAVEGFESLDFIELIPVVLSRR